MQNNPLTEIILGVLAVFFIAGAVFLLYVGKIDFAGATLMFGFPAALFGINQALKAPSPAQQQNMMQAMSDLTNVIPVIFQHTHPAPQAPPVAAPAPQPTPMNLTTTTGSVPPVNSVPIPVAQPDPQVPFPAKQSTFEMPVVPVQP